MSSVHLIDTFPAFLSLWPTLSRAPIEEQIEQWYSSYMASWPELRQKQLDDYEENGFDWRLIAHDRVFPHLNDRLPAMVTAHRRLKKAASELFHSSCKRLGFDTDIVVVLYVGIGCGAGWVTSYREKQAVLFGLENIAECGYEEQPILNGMVAHEFGHIAHFYWRAARGLPFGKGPMWQLYTEGFAQYCGHKILGQDLWHMKVTSSSDDWLSWCEKHKDWLAAEFLDYIDGGKSVTPFFGSWFDICGKKQTGYFLGHEIIKAMQADKLLSQIALSKESDFGMRLFLERMAGRSKQDSSDCSSSGK